MRIRLASPVLGSEELEAIEAVLTSGTLTNGPRTKEFEQLFARRHGVDHAIAFANGTVALSAMYLALGIGAGDEIIVPSMTFISSATSVLHVGARPVFADVCPDIFTLDPQDVVKRISKNTRAILAVHYGGQPADLDELQALADDAGVALLEDAAQAHGARYRGRPVGSFGQAAMFSFTPTKNITTGEGGMVTTNDGDMADRLRLLRNHGQSARYTHIMVGYNWRLSEIQAAIGIVQLGRLDGIIARKRANAAEFAGRLHQVAGVLPPIARDDREHVYMLFTTLIENGRDSVLESMISDGVEARLYFPPVHQQPIFQHERLRLPVTEQLGKNMLSLPFHSRLTQDDFEDIATTLKAAVDREALQQSGL